MICQIQSSLLHLRRGLLELTANFLILILKTHKVSLMVMLNLILKNCLCHILKRIQCIFLFQSHIAEFLLDSSNLIVIFFQIIERLIPIFPNRGSDHADFPVIRMNLIENLTSLLERFHVAHLCMVAQSDIHSSKNQDIKRINSCKINCSVIRN